MVQRSSRCAICTTTWVPRLLELLTFGSIVHVWSLTTQTIAPHLLSDYQIEISILYLEYAPERQHWFCPANCFQLKWGHKVNLSKNASYNLSQFARLQFARSGYQRAIKRKANNRVTENCNCNFLRLCTHCNFLQFSLPVKAPFCWVTVRIAGRTRCEGLNK